MSPKETVSDPPEWLSIAEAARRCGVDRTVIKALIEDHSAHIGVIYPRVQPRVNWADIVRVTSIHPSRR